jgi:uncharacterized protein YndB with AHSA1/START domain
MREATVNAWGDRPLLRFERFLSRPPSEVWRALTDRDELAGWFPCDIVTDEWSVGASLRFVFRGGESHDLEGTVLECEEPRVLAFTWGDETLRFELREAEGGANLVLVDELDRPIAARNAAGWEVCLERLEGNAPESELWKKRFDLYVERFSAALGPQEGPPEQP